MVVPERASSITNASSPFRYRANFASNMPLRGQKTTYWEGGVKSAGFIAGAGVLVSGSTAALVHVTDIYPSLLAHAARGIGGGATAASGPGGEPGDQPPFTLGDGIEQWLTMVNHPDRSAEDPRTEILHVVHLDSEHGPAVLRQGDYKLLADANTWDGQNGVWYATFGQSFLHNFSIKCPPPPGNASASQKPPGPGEPGHCVPNLAPCLFKVAGEGADPCEQRNIASVQPAILAQMTQRLAEYRGVTLRDMSTNRAKLPARCAPELNNGTWTPCFGSPPVAL